MYVFPCFCPITPLVSPFCYLYTYVPYVPFPYSVPFLTYCQPFSCDLLLPPSPLPPPPFVVPSQSESPLPPLSSPPPFPPFLCPLLICLFVSSPSGPLGPFPSPFSFFIVTFPLSPLRSPFVLLRFSHPFPSLLFPLSPFVLAPCSVYPRPLVYPRPFSLFLFYPTYPSYK